MRRLLRLAAAAVRLLGCGGGSPGDGGGCFGPPQPASHSFCVRNNTGETVYEFGMSYGHGPIRFGHGMGDGVWSSVGVMFSLPPQTVGVFWERPRGVRDERELAVAFAPTREHVTLNVLLRADGEADLVVLPYEQSMADGAWAAKELMTRGRPADKPPPPPIQPNGQTDQAAP